MREFKDSKVVMFYVSFNSEVDTHEMIKEALKSKRIAVPKVVEKEMQPSLLIDFDQMIPFGKFDILEPIELLKIELKNISLIIIPGIAFDRKGHRIGYGYGYYDDDEENKPVSMFKKTISFIPFPQIFKKKNK